jgi:hypothetical protein
LAHLATFNGKATQFGCGLTIASSEADPKKYHAIDDPAFGRAAF